LAPHKPTRIAPPLTRHSGAIYSAAFLPDGLRLATVSADQTTPLWDLTGIRDLRQHIVDRACAIAGRGLNPQEWAATVAGLPYLDTCPHTA
jgi:WD40 repeat protein